MKHTFKICGNLVSWTYTRLRGTANGWAYINRDGKRQKVLIHTGISGRLRLETECHEFIHIANPTLDEAHVTEQARDLARILYTLGYRLTR